MVLASGHLSFLCSYTHTGFSFSTVLPSPSLGPPSLIYNGDSRQFAGIKMAGEWNLLRIHKAYPYRRPLLFREVRLPTFLENLYVPSSMVKRLEDDTNRLSETSETTNLSWHPRKAKSSFTPRWKPDNTHSFPVVEPSLNKCGGNCTVHLVRHCILSSLESLHVSL